MKNPIAAPELRELLERRDLETIREVCRELHPATVAEFLESLEPAEIWRVLAALPLELRSEIFERFDLEDQSELVSGRGRAEVARLLEEMPPDDRADLVQTLDEEARDEILPLVARAEREEIRRLSSYEEGTAGSEMSTDYVFVRADTKVSEAIAKLRSQASETETIYTVYVVDDQHRLKGVVSLEKLILARPNQTVGDIMKGEVIFARADEDREEVARDFAKYDLLAMPVVNDNGVLVGTVTVDDVVDVIEEEADEDIYHLAAAGEPMDYLKASIFEIARQRIAWLLMLVVVGCISGLIMRQNREVLEMYVALMFFIPLMCGSGGNAGCQATIVVVRGLATGEIMTTDVLQVFRKELLVGLVIGLTLAVITGGLSFLMERHFALSLTLALAMFCTVLVAKIAGCLLPILFNAIGVDPAHMSAPLITTIVDIGSLLLYLQLARWIMGV